jgi:hypothetical protein
MTNSDTGFINPKMEAEGVRSMTISTPHTIISRITGDSMAQVK